MASSSATSLTESQVKSFRAKGLSLTEFTWLLRDADDITTQEYACLCALNARRPNIEVSQDRIAKDMKCSLVQSKRLVKSLRAKGWLTVLKLGSNLTHDPSVYDLLVPSAVAEEIRKLSETQPDSYAWFTGWYLTDTSLVSQGYQPSISGIPALVSDGYPKKTRTRSQSRNTTKKTPTIRAGISQIPEEESPSSSLPSEAVEFPGDVSSDAPNSSTEIISSDNQQFDPGNPGSYSLKPGETWYLRNEETRKLRPEGICLPWSWKNTDTTRWPLSDSEVSTLREQGRIN